MPQYGLTISYVPKKPHAVIDSASGRWLDVEYMMLKLIHSAILGSRALGLGYE